MKILLTAMALCGMIGVSGCKVIAAVTYEGKLDAFNTVKGSVNFERVLNEKAK